MKEAVESFSCDLHTSLLDLGRAFARPLFLFYGVSNSSRFKAKQARALLLNLGQRSVFRFRDPRTLEECAFRHQACDFLSLFALSLVRALA